MMAGSINASRLWKWLGRGPLGPVEDTAHTVLQNHTPARVHQEFCAAPITTVFAAMRPCSSTEPIHTCWGQQLSWFGSGGPFLLLTTVPLSAGEAPAKE